MDNPTPNKAQYEAEEWFVRMQSGNLSPEELARFQAWISEDPLHNTEYKKVEDDWETLADLSQDLSSTEPTDGPRQALPYEEDNSPNRTLFHLWPIAACLVLVVTVYFSTGFSSPIEPLQFVSAIGEQKQVTLKDGSEITLNTASTIEVLLTDKKRYIKLKQGEAYFKVAKDPSRPFTVDLDRGTVTALGTEFNIRRNRHLATIVITEGTVKVEESKTRTNLEPNSEVVTLNNQISFDQYGLTKTQEFTDTDILSWKSKTLVFNKKSLHLAIEELNRYLASPVEGVERITKDIYVSGTFDLTDPEEALLAILESNSLSLDKKTRFIK